VEKGKFIVFEGIDGSGKSTQIGLLEEAIPGAVAVECPSKHLKYGKAARKLLSNVGTTTKEAYLQTQTEVLMLSILDMYEQIPTIKALLAEGKTVICDRYFYSTMAYNTEGTITYSTIMKLAAQLPEPDYIVYLYLSAYTALERITTRADEKQLHENAVQLKKISANYEEIMRHYIPNTPVIQIRASMDVSLVHRLIVLGIGLEAVNVPLSVHDANNVITCPHCGFSGYDYVWHEAEWVYEGCPHCDCYEFEGVAKKRLSDFPYEEAVKILKDRKLHMEGTAYA